MPRAAQKSHLVVISLDVGTTHSGISYGHSRNRERIRTVLDLENDQGSNGAQPKIPTVISYHADGTVKNIGAAALMDRRRVQFAKLGLANETELVKNAQASNLMITMKRQLAAVGKSADEVISDYIRVFFARGIESLLRHEGQRYFERAELKIVYTIPAIWGMNGKGRMNTAVINSGILKENPVGEAELYSVIEPEAAALAALRCGRDSNEFLERGNTFIVSDLGGGTGDMISYRIIGSNPHTFSEAAEGDGDITGAVLLDQRFKKCLQSRILDNVKLSVNDPEVVMALESHWHAGIKPRFDGTDNRKWQCILPHVAGGDFNPNITFTARELRDIFDVEIDKATALVQNQVDQIKARHGRLPVAVLLVGGFGQSPYLFKRMEKAFPNIQIIQRKGPEMWSAVSQGAVIHGFNHDSGSAMPTSGVQSRIARASYGTVYNEIFDPELHAKKLRKYCPILQKDVAVGAISWFVKKGDSIPVKKTSKIPFSYVLKKQGEAVSADIVTCRADNPPHWVDPEVKMLCTLNWDNPPALKKLEWKVVGAGPTECKVYTVNYDVTMAVNGVSVDFQLFYKNKIQADWSPNLDEHGEPVVPEEGQVDDDDEEDEDFVKESPSKRRKIRDGRLAGEIFVLRESHKRRCRA